MKIGRREFVAGSTLALGGCKALERGYPEEYWVEQPPVPREGNWRQGEERFIKSLCLQCEGGCGIVARVIEGRAVSLRGNPEFPTNQGGVCPKGVNGLQVLYDPDRLKGPLVRAGLRGEGVWRPISWDEGISRVVGKLAELRAAGEPHAVAALSGRARGHLKEMLGRFLTAYGSPNDIDHESVCAGADKAAHYLTQGVRDLLAYDWDNTRYVLSFGAGLVESFRPTAMMLRVYGQLRGRTPWQRAKLVQIDPRFGVTAARADEWVQVRPGTDAALALAIAHVLIRDGLYDKAFVQAHVAGFDGWKDAAGRVHLGFKDLVLRDYAPEAAAKVCGVLEEDIERLAREFGTHPPAIAVAGRGVAAHSNGLYARLAVHALNALAGSIEVPGGVLVQRPPPLAPWPEPALDEVARAGLARPRVDLWGDAVAPLAQSGLASLAERIETGQPYPLKALLVYYTNPLFSSPNPQQLRTALAKVPFIVSFSPFMDETTAMADLVLPDHTYLERWTLEPVVPSVGFEVCGLRQPVVAPRHDTRSTGEVLLRVAKGLGGTVGAAFPASELELIKQSARGLFEARRGSVQADNFDDFWKKLVDAGGWWDKRYARGEWARVLATPSGKFELFASRLDERLTEVAKQRWPALEAAAARDSLLEKLGIKARGDEALLPHHEPPRPAFGTAHRRFTLVSYKTMTHAEGRGANQPHLQELFGVQFDRSWEPWVEIHPTDAAQLGIATDDEVLLRTTRGEVRLKAIVHQGGCEGVLFVPFEYGHTAYGRWAAGRGASVNPMAIAAPEPFTGGTAWFDLRVELEKA